MKTVSRVLNREPNVRDAVRERVLKSAAKLGYAPRLSARGLAGSRSYLLALLFENTGLSYISEIELGVLQRCREAHYHLIAEPINSDELTANFIAETFAVTRPDGLLLTPPICDNTRILDAIEAAGLTHVRIAPGRDLARGPYVRSHDRSAAHAMTTHLIALGHRDIGFILGHRYHGATAQRHQGHLDALREHGLPIRKALVAQGNFSFESGAACAQTFLKRRRRPTAIFASNDDMARGVMMVAERLGLQIPGDLSIAGFDDTPASNQVWPPLTTVRQPIREMAAAAADIAISLASSAREVSTERVLDFEIIVRGTTAKPPPAI